MATFQKFPFPHDPTVEKPYFYNWSDALQAGDKIDTFTVTCPALSINRVSLDDSTNIVSWWVNGCRDGQTYEIVVRITTFLGVKLKFTLELDGEVR